MLFEVTQVNVGEKQIVVNVAKLHLSGSVTGQKDVHNAKTSEQIDIGLRDFSIHKLYIHFHMFFPLLCVPFHLFWRTIHVNFQFLYTRVHEPRSTYCVKNNVSPPFPLLTWRRRIEYDKWRVRTAFIFYDTWKAEKSTWRIQHESPFPRFLLFWFLDTLIIVFRWLRFWRSVPICNAYYSPLHCGYQLDAIL